MISDGGDIKLGQQRRGRIHAKWLVTAHARLEAL